MPTADIPSQEDYLSLQAIGVLADALDNLARVLNNNGAALLTVCPSCRVDDFDHMAGCPLALQAEP